jgi:ATP-dependent RNA helicase SUPV3L1/SUV3
VHLKEWKFANPSEARNAGYRRIGDEYVRIDLAERVIKKAHEARGQANLFGMDLAFATSLGISEAGLKALMRDAGFRPAEAPAEATDEAVIPVADEGIADPTDGIIEITEVESEPPVLSDAAPPVATVAPQPVVLTHWRWVGLPKPRAPEQRQQRARPEPRKPSSGGQAKAKPDRAPPPPKPASPPSALALQLAALKGLKL